MRSSKKKPQSEVGAVYVTPNQTEECGHRLDKPTQPNSNQYEDYWTSLVGRQVTPKPLNVLDGMTPWQVRNLGVECR